MALGKKTGGGSRHGKPNRAKVAFRVALQSSCDAKGVNPFYLMVDMRADPTMDDPHLKFLAMKELCQYVEPKLRAVTIAGDAERPLRVTVASNPRRALEQAYGTDTPWHGHAVAAPALD